MKANSTGKKVLWSIIGLIALTASISNFPALIGLVAIYVLYVVYKNWKNHKEDNNNVYEDNDPFTNFERQWSELKKN